MSDHGSSSAGQVASSNRSRPLITLAVTLALMLAIVATGTWVTGTNAESTMPDGQVLTLGLQDAETTPDATAEQETDPVGDLSTADVAELANPAVVTVFTFVPESEQPGMFVPGQESEPGNDGRGLKPEADEDTDDTTEQVPYGAGSGWIYTEDGYVVTNAHVVSGADSFVIQYFDGTQVEAELIGTDTMQDVAVLKIDLGDGETVPAVARVGDSSTVRAGDEVVAIGSPLGEFLNSVSEGNVGGLDRSLDAGDGTSLDNLIQHDAEISPGNSGGPLFNMQGEVIGMNVAKIETASSNGATASGLNFAIDGNTVVEIVDEIIERGDSVAYPYVGIQTQLTEDGPVIVDVEVDGPAADSGLQPGDILLGINDERVDDSASFTSILMGYEPGDTVSVIVDRDGEELAFDVTLGECPAEI
jgi:2-alkenal reductase